MSTHSSRRTSVSPKGADRRNISSICLNRNDIRNIAYMNKLGERATYMEDKQNEKIKI